MRVAMMASQPARQTAGSSSRATGTSSARSSQGSHAQRAPAPKVASDQATTSDAPTDDATRPFLVVGGTGRTGRRALEGLLSAGVAPGDIALLSSRPSAPSHAELLAQGLAVVGADLDSDDSLRALLAGSPRAFYIHALSGDAASADPAELARAERLAAALADSGVGHVVYNSSAGRGCGAGISQMDQKHRVEDIFMEAGLPFTALQATLFMEELWKGYTRPGILKGTFAFAVPPEKQLHLVSVKDMVRVAAQVMAAPEEFIGKSVPLAGDALTPLQMAAAFGAAQGHQPNVVYKHLPAWPFWLLNRDLYRICRFYSTQGYGVDAAACRERFGLQDFASFLEETNWGDPNAEVLA